MTTRRRGGAVPIALAVVAATAALAVPRPAIAFRTGQSPDFPNCTIWFNDAGKPLRSKAGREIGADVPCPGQAVQRDTYTVVAGEAKNTLLIRDRTHHLECTLVLAPGSGVVVVPKICRVLAP